MYEYRCKIVRVVDGDTVDVDIDLGFNSWIHNERVRLNGVDTPESRTSDTIEKFFGLIAKHHLETMLPVDSIQVLQTATSSSTEKYGRTLGHFKLGDSTVNAWLIENNHAVAYEGQNKDMIAATHKENYKKLLNLDPTLHATLVTEAKTTDDKVAQYLTT
jgi:micrococcal nuclease